MLPSESVIVRCGWKRETSRSASASIRRLHGRQRKVYGCCLTDHLSQSFFITLACLCDKMTSARWWNSAGDLAALDVVKSSGLDWCGLPLVWMSSPIPAITYLVCQGERGHRGRPGRDGPPGKDGEHGDDGEPGDSGAPGPQVHLYSGFFIAIVTCITK